MPDSIFDIKHTIVDVGIWNFKMSEVVMIFTGIHGKILLVSGEPTVLNK